MTWWSAIISPSGDNEKLMAMKKDAPLVQRWLLYSFYYERFYLLIGIRRLLCVRREREARERQYCLLPFSPLRYKRHSRQSGGFWQSHDQIRVLDSRTGG